MNHRKRSSSVEVLTGQKRPCAYEKKGLNIKRGTSGVICKRKTVTPALSRSNTGARTFKKDSRNVRRDKKERPLAVGWTRSHFVELRDTIPDRGTHLGGGGFGKHRIPPSFQDREGRGFTAWVPEEGKGEEKHVFEG